MTGFNFCGLDSEPVMPSELLKNHRRLLGLPLSQRTSAGEALLWPLLTQLPITPWVENSSRSNVTSQGGTGLALSQEPAQGPAV